MKFKDVEVGQEFTRYLRPGYVWEKNSATTAIPVYNLGKKERLTSRSAASFGENEDVYEILSGTLIE